MKTVNELKKLPASELNEAINLDVINCRKARETQLNAGYLERHPEETELPDFILEANEELAMHFTMGGLQALLEIAIQELQTAEAELKAACHDGFISPGVIV